MPCSRMPARIVLSICSRVRWSITIESMPAGSQQVREQQAGRAGADDGDAGADRGGHVVSFDGGNPLQCAGTSGILGRCVSR